MRTARALTVSPSMLCIGRGCTWSRGGVPGPGGVTWFRGCTWSRGGYLVWGVYLAQGGVPGRGGVPGLGGVLAQVLPPPWTEWQTGVKILPCPKLLLRAVINHRRLCLISLSDWMIWATHTYLFGCVAVSVFNVVGRGEDIPPRAPWIRYWELLSIFR